MATKLRVWARQRLPLSEGARRGLRLCSNRVTDR
jgi:hypothetical protein